MPDLPEPLKTIAALRAEVTPEPEIARQIGKTRRRMWGIVAKWNRENPDNKLPRPHVRPETPFYVQVAERAKRGDSVDQIAADLELPRQRVQWHLAQARKSGRMPSAPPRVSRGGAYAYHLLRNAGGAPALGYVSAIVDTLTYDEILALLNTMRRDETTLAQTIARHIKEMLVAARD
jgi:hypothetical protein